MNAEPSSTPSPQPPAAIAAAPAAPQRELRFAGSNEEQREILEQLSRAEPGWFKPVGSTSTVFHVRFRNAPDAAFKASTRDRPRGPASEVAAYRLSRCLQLDNVPPAVSRQIAVETIHAMLDRKYADRWNEIRERMLVSADGMVRGAAIHWIPSLANIGIDKQHGLNLLQQWLHVGTELPAQKQLAASLSSMLGFDFLIANFDRFSGDNVKGDADATLVYMRDNDVAFPSKVGPSLQKRLLKDVSRAERFSRRFYASLKHFTRACFEQELAHDPEAGNGPLLDERQIADLLERRRTLLSQIDSLIARYGERQVLTFE